VAVTDAGSRRRVRVGIDVGGTFTHAVAIDAVTFDLLATVKVPTTHTAREGVARGIVDSIHRMLEEGHITPEEITLIAHSTTQATNALLEGDVAPVGIVGMARGFGRRRARSETRCQQIELAPGRSLRTFHRFLSTEAGLTRERAKRAVEELVEEGAQVIVASELFGVDDPANEDLVVDVCKEIGVLATDCHSISRLYGLRVRTRTAVINASMMPRMLETADMTERSVREAGITAPLMIMRSDGGIMDIGEMRRRPILTMLSGPAAGIAAALMCARISDGIFLEVGGTSTDIAAIKNGKALIKSATVGGHRLHVRTLDSRTVGVAGGSIPRVSHGRVIDVGPRSAHIANLGYAAFTPSTGATPFEVERVAPCDNDSPDHVMVTIGGVPATVTPTCAANVDGHLPPGDNCRGDEGTIRRAFDAIGSELMNGAGVKAVAEQILDCAVPKLIRVVEGLIRDYEMDRGQLTLTGGGGGASALVPHTAKRMHLPHVIAPNSPVISAIGAALALVRDMVERTVVEPTEGDILAIWREAEEAVVRMGAHPDSVEVQVEVDSQRSILRAVATGTTEMRTRDLADRADDDEDLERRVRESLRGEVVDLGHVADAGELRVFQARTEHPRLLGLMRSRSQPLRVIDREGIIRLQIADGEAMVTTKARSAPDVRELLEGHTDWGDAGRSLPPLFVAFRGRILDFTGLTQADQVQGLLGVELDHLEPGETVVGLISRL
jgi:N-methylhydantoinase A/oxoprolinase/acetone carboxylase beta subunit